jgi:site-specific DNA recombinase
VPALIDQETYRRAQEQLERNATLSFRNNTRHAYLLRCLNHPHLPAACSVA